MNKLNFIYAILFAIVAACLITATIILITGSAPFWLVALYAVCSSIEGINAFLYFKLWHRLRKGG